MSPKRTPIRNVPAEEKEEKKEKPRSAQEHAAVMDDMFDSMQEEMNEAFGKGTAQRLSSAATLSKVEFWVSTRSLIVDKVLLGARPTGASLIPFGRQTEISGLPGVGKTTLCAQLAAEVQQSGGFVVVTDTEERIDHPYWQSLGVNTDKILNLTARTLEEVFEKQHKFIETSNAKWPKIPILMLWDSLGGTSTDSILEEKDEKGHQKKDSIMTRAKKAMMVKAKLISAGMEVINPLVAKSKVAYVYTNTLYQKPDVDYGDPWVTPGGNKKDFFATVRIRLRRKEEIAREDETVSAKNVLGHRVEVKALKNSMAPQLRTIEAVIVGGRGFCNEYTVWEIADSMKLITKSGAWSTWTTPKGEEVKFQGWNGFLEKVATHPEYPDLFAAVAERI